MMKFDSIVSSSDGLKLDIAYIVPKKEALGVVQISHGMAEHKERYFDFMHFLASCGYICVISDDRGHEKSIKNEDDLGYFYTDNIEFIVNDLYEVTLYIKKKFKDKKIYLFSHSMGTLVSRCYIEKYDWEIEKLVLYEYYETHYELEDNCKEYFDVYLCPNCDYAEIKRNMYKEMY